MGSSKQLKQDGIRTPAWHTMSALVVCQALGTSRDGLAQALVDARLKRVQVKKPSSFFHVYFFAFCRQFKSPLTLVLVFAAGVTFYLQEYTDTVVILLACLLAVCISMVQEGRAARAFEKLKQYERHDVHVVRDGVPVTVTSDQLVLGDVVVLRPGIEIPFLIRIIEGVNITAAALHDGVLLTSQKDVDGKLEKQGDVLSNMIPGGSFIERGEGLGVIVGFEDGIQKQRGDVALDVPHIVSPIEWEMKNISRLLFRLITAVVVVLFIVGIVRGVPLYTMFLTSVAIAVAAIPEGLPAAVAIVLALGVQALAKRGGLIRNVNAAETLGSITYLLTDISHVITFGKESIAEVIGTHAYHDSYRYGWNGAATSRDFDYVIRVALRASSLGLFAGSDATSTAIHAAAREAGMSSVLRDIETSRVCTLPKTDTQRFMCAVTQDKHSLQTLSVVGVPEHIFEVTTSHRGTDGEHFFDEDMQAYFSERVLEARQQGYTVYAVAERQISSSESHKAHTKELFDLAFVGLLVVDDVIREDIKEAIQSLQSRGVTVAILTDTEPVRACAVARRIGLAGSYDAALVGNRILHMTDSELYKIAKITSVFAGFSLRQKSRLLSVLQKYGEVISVTGSDIADVGLVHKANVGIALGSSQAVLREASDLVLVKDDITVVGVAVGEGRRIVTNLKKIVAYLISTSLGEAVLIGTALSIGAPIPLLPVQILWANIMEEGLMSLAFAFEPEQKDSEKIVRDVDAEGILSHDMRIFILCTVFLLSSFLLVLYLIMLRLGVSIETMRSVMFLAISLDSLCITFSFRSLTKPFWRISLWSNRFFIISFFVSASMLMLVLTVPFLQHVFSYQPLQLHYILLTFVYGALSLIAIETAKALIFSRKSST